MGSKRARVRRLTKQTGKNPKELASCYGKIRYDRLGAKQRADGISTMKAYNCRFCDYWHVGRKPRAK